MSGRGAARTLDRSVKRELLRGTPLFAALRPAELEELLGFVGERRFPRGATILQRGEEGASMLVLAIGRARVSAISPDGKDLTLSLMGPGAVIGELALLDGKPRSADVTAMEECLVLVVERRDFLPFLRRNEDLTLRLLALLCERLRRTDIALEEIALLDLPSRLARLLLKLAQEYGAPAGDGVRIRLKLSQKDLSGLVAATRESVNKQLAQWRENGMLGEDGGMLVIRKPDVLRAMLE
jgi:CRP/FNR family transcriptional regulator, cyclic AMP receptor protein